MPVIQLTDLAIQNLSEGLWFDKNTPAFGIRVGKRRSLHLGYPQSSPASATIYAPAWLTEPFGGYFFEWNKVAHTAPLIHTPKNSAL